MEFPFKEKAIEFFLAIVVSFGFIISILGIVFGQVNNLSIAFLLTFGGLLPIMIFLWGKMVLYYIQLNRENTIISSVKSQNERMESPEENE